MGIEPTDRRSRASPTVLKTAPVTRAGRFATFVRSSIEAAIVQLVFVEAQQVPHLVQHGDADLLVQFFAGAGEALEVLLEERDAHRLVVAGLGVEALVERRAGEHPEDGG